MLVHPVLRFTSGFVSVEHQQGRPRALFKRIKDTCKAVVQAEATWRHRDLEKLDKGAQFGVHIGGPLEVEAPAGDAG